MFYQSSQRNGTHMDGVWPSGDQSNGTPMDDVWPSGDQRNGTPMDGVWPSGNQRNGTPMDDVWPSGEEHRVHVRFPPMTNYFITPRTTTQLRVSVNTLNSRHVIVLNGRSKTSHWD